MNYSWVIDQRKCIGCHACTTACKSENEVPLSVDRTWVKYVEKGTFPNSQRHFGVLRCNHCANPPCVDICPTTAMFQRPDGIVEFNSDACIGCKGCIAACPYDAIYIDPNEGTAAKCNFCTHRLDVGLEPACVVVCPEEALIFGDLDDPKSRVSELVGREKVQVRKPEKNTDPKCFYIGADEAVLNPDIQTHDESGMYMWSAQRDEKHGAELDNNPPSGLSLSRALNTVTGAKVAYDVHHDIPWGKEVSLYLWTKSMSAGVFIMTWLFWIIRNLSPATLPFAQSTQFAVEQNYFQIAGLSLPLYGPDWTFWLGPLVALTTLALTGVLLIKDLDRPERFWMILTRPQWKSWLALGSYIITAYAFALVVDLILFVGGAAPVIVTACYYLTLPVAVMTAIYTAFLFAQAKGRDLWQSPLLPFQLLVQALLAGASLTMITAVILGDNSNILSISSQVLVVALALHLFLLASGEIFCEHSSKAKARAVNLMIRGPYSTLFWIAGIIAGGILPLVALGLDISSGVTQFGPYAAVLALSGLLAYEHCFVMAGQSVRLS